MDPEWDPKRTKIEHEHEYEKDEETYEWRIGAHEIRVSSEVGTKTTYAD